MSFLKIWTLKLYSVLTADELCAGMHQQPAGPHTCVSPRVCQSHSCFNCCSLYQSTKTVTCIKCLLDRVLNEIRLHNLVETFYDLIKFQPNLISLVKWLLSLRKSAWKLFYKKHKKDLWTSPLSVCMLRGATASSPSPLCLCVPRMASEYWVFF